MGRAPGQCSEVQGTLDPTCKPGFCKTRGKPGIASAGSDPPKPGFSKTRDFPTPRRDVFLLSNGKLLNVTIVARVLFIRPNVDLV